VLFALINNPWGLFYYRPYEWYVWLSPTVGVSYVSMIGIVLIIKTYLYFRKRPFVIRDQFRRFYRPVALYIIFLIFWSIVYGHNIVSIFYLLQTLPVFLIFISVPTLLLNNELKEFNRIIFLFSLIHFLGSTIEIAIPGSFMPLLFFGPPPTGVLHGEVLTRFVGGISIHLYVMMLGLYYVSRRETGFQTWYLWLLILTSYIFILNSATRGWMIASSVLLILFFLQNVFSGKLSARTMVIVVIILASAFIIIPESFKRNMSEAFNRLETLEAIAEGDDTAEGTLTRISYRGPQVLSRFSESPIVGFGFSKVSAELYDEHVGNHDLILMGGVIGLAVIWISMILIIIRLFRYDWRYPGNGIYVLGLSLIVIMIIHSSSRSMISYYMSADAVFFISLIFNHLNASYPFGPVPKIDHRYPGIKNRNILNK